MKTNWIAGLTGAIVILVPSASGRPMTPGEDRASASSPKGEASHQRRNERSALSLETVAGTDIVAALKKDGLFKPVLAFYAGHMGKVYDAAMAVVSEDRHYLKLRDDETYLDPTTEVHESLHGMSSLIRNAMGESIADGFNAIYVGKGQFAVIRLRPGITKKSVRDWMPRILRNHEIVRTHLENPDFSKGHVSLIVEELAYHALDGQIGLEDHQYIERKLRISNAVTAPAAVWSVLALATATMVDADPRAFASQNDRNQWNALVKKLVETSVSDYARGMDSRQYGMLANRAPELRELFESAMSEPSRQVRQLRDYCDRTFGNAWLDSLLEQVKMARDSTELAGQDEGRAR